MVLEASNDASSPADNGQAMSLLTMVHELCHVVYLAHQHIVVMWYVTCHHVTMQYVTLCHHTYLSFADFLLVAEISAHLHIAVLFLFPYIYAYCRLANELLTFLFTCLQKVDHKISPWRALYIAPPEVELRPQVVTNDLMPNPAFRKTWIRTWDLWIPSPPRYRLGC